MQVAKEHTYCKKGHIKLTVVGQRPVVVGRQPQAQQVALLVRLLQHIAEGISAGCCHTWVSSSAALWHMSKIAAMPQGGFDAHLPVNKGCAGVEDGVVVQQLDVCSTTCFAIQSQACHDSQLLAVIFINMRKMYWCC